VFLYRPRHPFDRVEGEEEQDVGPVIQFGGVTGRWTGSYHAGRNSVGIEARVNFEAHAGERTMSFLEIGNSGTTVLYFNWKVRSCDTLAAHFVVLCLPASHTMY